MPHRDPQTGQFVADSNQYDDIEVATFGSTVGIPAADLDGSASFTGGDGGTFEGLEVIDYDEIVDRNESLVLLAAHHALSVMVNSTQTADGSVRAAIEVSADPSRALPTLRAQGQTGGDLDGDVDGTASFDDTIDLVGRPLIGAATGPFSDGSTGVGGGAAAAADRYDIQMAPAEFGRFHPRDELFLNGDLSVDNIDDAGVHASISGQHVYGVLSD